MYDFWHFWDQTNCPYYRGVSKERFIDSISDTFYAGTPETSLSLAKSRSLSCIAVEFEYCILSFLRMTEQIVLV